MKKPEKKPSVKLINKDGNAFLILGKVRKVLKKAGADQEYIDHFYTEATSGDYNHLLATVMKYVEVE